MTKSSDFGKLLQLTHYISVDIGPIHEGLIPNFVLVDWPWTICLFVNAKLWYLRKPYIICIVLSRFNEQ